jgi:hypothetical protein|nr:MAG TPA: hypothetical protein [Caudoviricetes sp.]
MRTINTFIPSDLVDSLKKFADKTQKNVEGFAYSVGKPYQKLFQHPVINENGISGGVSKVFHEVCDLIVNMPDESDWRLIATYMDGAFIPADPTKELIFKNSSHGADYGKCDFCGHWCKNAYVVENVKTGEELQVGCECIKKFGIKGFGFLSDFTRKLYELYDYRISYATDDEFGDIEKWGGRKDSSYKNAILKSDLIMAAKAQYDICPVYKKGTKVEHVRYRSATLDGIDTILNSKKFKVDEAYVKAVCEFGAKIQPKTEFEEDMLAVAKNFYCFQEQDVYAFFLVKAYEDSLKPELSIQKGNQVKVCGKIIQKRFEESYFGMMEINTILTDKGIECERYGKVPTIEENGIKRTTFYALVKGVFNGKISLNRATKNPKKGIEVVEI